MDKITENLVEDYISSNELSIKNMDDKFELFSSYCIISKEYDADFDIEQVWLNDSAIGIDAISIIVNGRLIESKEEIDDLIEFNKYLEATFIFIQSKTSSNFDSKEIGNFIFGVSDFFEEKPTIPRSDKLKEKAEIVNYIHSKSGFMSKGSPVCKLFYITTGTWKEDQVINSRFESGKQELLQKSLFSKVTITPIDARSIQKYYQDTKATVSREIVFSNKTLLPEIKDVEQAYVGTIKYDDFIKLITDEEGKIMSSIFYDNVRAFQGENPVNKKIQETLNKGKFDLFSILNNGITIVAKSLRVSANDLTLNDFSIVNGCQTSHVLYNSKDLKDINKVNVPIRLIESNNEAVRNDMIRATNSQTQVRPEELEALSDFQKTLELFYQTTKEDLKLFYERRSKQYNANPSIIKTRIISIPIQIKSFAAMFLKEPHLVSRFYGRIIKYLGEKIFVKDHKQIVYYTTALAFFRLDQLFRSKYLDSKYKKCRYHMLMLVPLVIANISRPQFNSNKIEEYCNNIIEELKDTKKSMAIFNKITKIIDESGVDIDDRDTFKLQSTNELLLKPLEKTKNCLASQN
ncbi:MAG: AIPR family protein [Candidatus Aenigmarchaeota archaeon]|nr:AIPR family protein [Candidatus Aenigmarchaeota archaeon]